MSEANARGMPGVSEAKSLKSFNSALDGCPASGHLTGHMSISLTMRYELVCPKPRGHPRAPPENAS